MTEQKIRVAFIIEILGRPAEHVKETMEQLVERFSKEKGVSLRESKVHDPIEYEEEGKKDEKKAKLDIKQQLYTTFAEIEADFENLESLLMVIFNYMPSNIEVISPEDFFIKKDYISSILTGIVVRLHRYDELTKKLVVDRNIMEAQLRQVLEKKQLYRTIEPENEESSDKKENNSKKKSKKASK